MADEVSPTGKPVLPRQAVPFFTIGLMLLGALSEVIPPHTIVGKILQVLVPLLPGAAAVSQGMRSKA